MFFIRSEISYRSYYITLRLLAGYYKIKNVLRQARNIYVFTKRSTNKCQTFSLHLGHMAHAKRIAPSSGNLLKKTRVECNTGCYITSTACRIKFDSQHNYSRLLWDKCQVPTLRCMVHKCVPYCEVSCLNSGCYNELTAFH